VNKKYGLQKWVMGIALSGMVGLIAACGGGVAAVWTKIKKLGVAGFTNGGLDGNTLTGTNDSYVAKYNSSGVKQ